MELGPILRRLAADGGDTLMPSELPRISRTDYDLRMPIPRHMPSPRFLASGWVLGSKNLPDGRRQELQLFMPGDHITDFGDEAAPWQTLLPVSKASVVSFSVSEESDKRFMKLLGLTRRASERRLFDHLLRLGRMDARERTAHFLRDVYTRWAETHSSAFGPIPFPLNQAQMADYLAMSPVHMNRVLQDLKRAGAINLAKGLTIDPELLTPFLTLAPSA